jgi:hypothetical protein
MSNYGISVIGVRGRAPFGNLEEDTTSGVRGAHCEEFDMQAPTQEFPKRAALNAFGDHVGKIVGVVGQ